MHCIHVEVETNVQKAIESNLLSPSLRITRVRKSEHSFAKAAEWDNSYLTEVSCSSRFNRRRFGGIDSTIGFTLKLIDSVVANCEFVSSAEQIFSSLQIWERTHPKVIMEVIRTVWGNWIMFFCQLWSIDYEQSHFPLRDIRSRENMQALKKVACGGGRLYIGARPQISLSTLLQDRNWS